MTDTRPLAKQDRYTFFYTFLTCGLLLYEALILSYDRLINFYFFLIIVLGLPELLFAVYLLVRLGVNAYRKNWRRVASILAAPVIAWTLSFLPGCMGITPDLIQLEICKSSYLKEVDEMKITDGSTRMKVWNWGVTGGAAAPNLTYTLAYDESDQIALKPTQRSPEWKRKAAEIEKLDGEHNMVGTVQHLEGHFYLVTQYLG